MAEAARKLDYGGNHYYQISFVTRAGLPEIADQLAGLGEIAPELVAAELRPLLRDLEARRGTCAQCRGPYIHKRYRSRGRFCDDTCRNRWFNSRRNLKR